MTKITADHLGHGVHSRKSTADQLLHNPDHQYGSPIVPGSLRLTTRSRSSTMIFAARAVASIGRASSACWQRSAKPRRCPVPEIEASRLAHNGRDWHTLMVPGTRTVIVDEDRNLRHPNDRLLLGMKGTMSELELSLFRQRSRKR